MKGLYIYTGIDLTDKSSGISNKILKQIDIMKKSGLDITVIGLDNKSEQNFIENIKFVLPFSLSKYEKRMVTLQNVKIDWANIDFIYIRKITFCHGFELLMKKIKRKNPNILIILEIPTYPFKNEYNGIKTILGYIGIFYLKRLYKYIDYIVTYSRDEEIYKIPTIITSNGVDLERIKVKQESKSKDINMIAVAYFSMWHGYDRLIEGLNNYYKNNSKPSNVTLYLVGSGDYLKYYKILINKYNLQHKVFVLGAKSGEELDAVYNKCNIAVDALGRHRSGVFYNSSLKGKEYCAKGLPIVSGVETELDFIKDYKYYLRVPADDSPIDINTIIKFYNSIYEKESERIVINKIRKFCNDKFEFNKTFKPIIDTIYNCKKYKI